MVGLRTIHQNRARTWGVPLVCALLMSLHMPATANIQTQYATMSRQSDGAYALNADFRMQVPTPLRDAIEHGTPLVFRVEFEVTRPRWYWMNETIYETAREQRIAYNSLTREYRVGLGNEQFRYQTLSDALTQVSRVSQWRVLPANQYRAGQAYKGALRMYLDTSKLPRSFQLSALSNQRWGLSSDWYSFNFTP